MGCCASKVRVRCAETGDGGVDVDVDAAKDASAKGQLEALQSLAFSGRAQLGPLMAFYRARAAEQGHDHIVQWLDSMRDTRPRPYQKYR